MSLLIVITAIAVFVSFGALWMSSVAMKRAESQITEFVNVVRRDFGGLRSEVDGKIAAVESKMAKLMQRVDQAKDAEATTHQMINDVNRDLAVLRGTVTDIETSIPPQFRRRKPMTEQDRVQN